MTLAQLVAHTYIVYLFPNTNETGSMIQNNIQVNYECNIMLVLRLRLTPFTCFKTENYTVEKSGTNYYEIIQTQDNFCFSTTRKIIITGENNAKNVACVI